MKFVVEIQLVDLNWGLGADLLICRDDKQTFLLYWSRPTFLRCFIALAAELPDIRRVEPCTEITNLTNLSVRYAVRRRAVTHIIRLCRSDASSTV
jgi:hypothetical protein